MELGYTLPPLLQIARNADATRPEHGERYHLLKEKNLNKKVHLGKRLVMVTNINFSLPALALLSTAVWDFDPNRKNNQLLAFHYFVI